MPTTASATKRRIAASARPPRARRQRAPVTTAVPTAPPSHVKTRASHSTPAGTVSATQRATSSSTATTWPPRTKAEASTTKASVPRAPSAASTTQTRPTRYGLRPVTALVLLARAAPAGVVAADVALLVLDDLALDGSLRRDGGPERARPRRRSRRRRTRSRARTRAPAAPRPAAAPARPRPAAPRRGRASARPPRG